MKPTRRDGKEEEEEEEEANIAQLHCILEDLSLERSVMMHAFVTLTRCKDSLCHMAALSHVSEG
jgi:hypothetical protein